MLPEAYAIVAGWPEPVGNRHRRFIKLAAIKTVACRQKAIDLFFRKESVRDIVAEAAELNDVIVGR